MDARPILSGLLIVGLGAMAMPARAAAQAAPPPDLSKLSIEDLMNVEITSASRKQERSVDAAAAVHVITQEDIERSGLGSIPDVLRLVPGVQVASINASHWAVSVRGFNDLYSNKLLVLVDGRSVYNRIFSGVLWDAQDLMLDDVERIEVIRGPGAAQWGANAVNGVINIITKHANETRGLLARADAGTEGAQAAVRYGGTVGKTDYRIFAQLTDRGPSLMPDGAGANDPSQAFTAGFRTDRAAGTSEWMVAGGVAAGRLKALWTDLDPAARASVVDVRSTTNGAHVIGRWTLTRASGAALQLQSFFDRENRDEPVGDYSRRALDIDSQYRRPFGTRHDVVAGAGYRRIVESLGPSMAISLVPETNRVSLFSVFAQDEISFFRDRLSFTLGAQAQHDSNAGSALQPTARVIWKVRSNQRLWAATSHAVRTPSLSNAGIQLTYPPVATPSGVPLVVRVAGNPAMKSEDVNDVEAGYRRDWGAVASIDVTAFHAWYDRLVTTEEAAPVLEFEPTPQLVVHSTFGNGLSARTRGLELSGHWMPVSAWRFDFKYAAFHLTPTVDASSADVAAASSDGNTPGQQWRLAASFSPTARATLYAALDSVGRLRVLDVDAYTRLDATIQVHLTPRLTVMAIGQNLLDASHAEHRGSAALLLATEVPRAISVRLRWVVR